MDKLIDKFYNGSMHKFGFGTVGSIQPNTLNHKVMTPRPKIMNSNPKNQTLLNKNRTQNNINTINSLYNKSKTVFNEPIPKTQYSMGLNAPTISDPLTTKGLTIPYKQPQYNGMETVSNGQTKRYFKPEILKVQMLEQKIKEIEQNCKNDKRRMREIIEGNVLNVNPPPKNQNITKIDTSEINNLNANNNPQNLEEAMNNLRTQNNGILDINQKQALRREQIQRELSQAREKLKMDKFSSYVSKDNSEEDEEEDEEEEDEESEKILKNNNNNNDMDQNLLNIGARPGPRTSLKSKTSKYKFEKGETMNPAEKEANDFIHNIPDHVALKLQADNFKVRANLAQVKDGFRNIRNVLEDKLYALQMTQKVNFEKVRFIIEQGGSNKMKAGLRKLIDGEDIDINNVEEDIPEYVKNLPDIIDEKLKKNEQLRRDQLNQEKIEEQRMIDDEIGERFNVIDENALKEFDPDNIRNDNTEGNPWEMNKQTDYQYIPGRGVKTKTNKYITNKYNYYITAGGGKRGSGADKDKNNLYGRRLITEEHENIIVNKIAEKIFRTMKDNNFMMDGMYLNNLNNLNQPPITVPKEPSKHSSKEGDQSIKLSSRDGDTERKSNLAEKQKPSVESKTKSTKTKTTSKKNKKKKKKKKETTEEEEEEEEEEGEEEEDDEEGEEEEDDEEEGEEEEDDE